MSSGARAPLQGGAAESWAVTSGGKTEEIFRLEDTRVSLGKQYEDTQEKIEVVKGRLMRDFGYDEISATDVLNYVASIFARGDTKGE